MPALPTLSYASAALQVVVEAVPDGVRVTLPASEGAREGTATLIMARFGQFALGLSIGGPFLIRAVTSFAGPRGFLPRFAYIVGTMVVCFAVVVVALRAVGKVFAARLRPVAVDVTEDAVAITARGGRRRVVSRHQIRAVTVSPLNASRFSTVHLGVESGPVVTHLWSAPTADAERAAEVLRAALQLPSAPAANRSNQSLGSTGH